MKQSKFSLRHASFLVAAFAMVASLAAPAVSFAAQTTGRSVELSSASVSANNVTYDVKFTTAGSAGAFVVDFCANSPLIGQSCTAPSGFSVNTATTATAGFAIDSSTANKLVISGAMTASQNVSVEVAGIANPSVAGPLYARVITYDTAGNAGSYQSDALGSGAQDQGSIAISITPTVGVSGVVLETLTFCVSGTAIGANCASTTAPIVELGEQIGDQVALTAGVLSEGSVHTQISTNASNGAVVRLKSSATNCGGLIRAGAPAACDILPALNTGIDKDVNEAKFGVKTATATDTAGVGANGTLAPVSGSFYNNSTFAMNFITGNATGITSTYGDPFLDTGSAPANNKNMVLTFGATVANNTPAGSYSADLSLIAVGKF